MSTPDVVAIRKPQGGVLRGERPHLRDLSRAELSAWVARELGGPPYRAEQIFSWVHGKRVTSVDNMTDIGRDDRVRLTERADLSALTVHVVQTARDGTRKLRLHTVDGARIEAVLIPNEGRGYTQCISSMVGCSLTCRFCATASLGFRRNLATWEILDQVYQAQTLFEEEAKAAGADWPERITNVVFMGMGEPLHNFGPVQKAIALLIDPQGAGLAGRRITVSTAGIVPAIARFAREGLGAEVGLAVSLNATTDSVRDQIMPINTRWNIAALLAAVRACPTPRRRRITFEYVLLADVNDHDADARRLGTLLDDLHCQINLIPFNPHPHAPYHRPDSARVQAFTQILKRSGLPVFVRAPRGQDIDAACGQLAAADRTCPTL